MPLDKREINEYDPLNFMVKNYHYISKNFKLD
jgi:hypothetical protein